MLLDTCESGATFLADFNQLVSAPQVRGKKGLSVTAAAGTELLDFLSRESDRSIFRDPFNASGALVLASCMGNQPSFEPAIYNENSNGFFTEAVIDCLTTSMSDLDGSGTIDEFEMKEWSLAYVGHKSNYMQTPNLERSSYNKEFNFKYQKQLLRDLSLHQAGIMLQRYIANNSLEYLEYLLDLNFDYSNAVQSDSVITALENKHGGALDLLLSRDFPSDVSNDTGESGIMFVMRTMDLYLIDILITHGSPVPAGLLLYLEKKGENERLVTYLRLEPEIIIDQAGPILAQAVTGEYLLTVKAIASPQLWLEALENRRYTNNLLKFTMESGNKELIRILNESGIEISSDNSE